MDNCELFEKLSISGCGARGGACIKVGGWSVVFDKKPEYDSKICVFMWWGCCCCACVGVFAFDFVGGYGITDCGVKWGECPIGRGLSAVLIVVMTEYGCFSVCCVWGFLIKSLKDDFLGVDCLVASLYE